MLQTTDDTAGDTPAIFRRRGMPNKRSSIFQSLRIARPSLRVGMSNGLEAWKWKFVPLPGIGAEIGPVSASELGSRRRQSAPFRRP